MGLKVPNWTHLKPELLGSALDVLIQLDTRTSQEALLPRFQIVSLIESKILSQVSPQVVILGDKGAVSAGLVKVGQILSAQEFQDLLQGRSDHFVQKQTIGRLVRHHVLALLGFDHIVL